MYEDLRKEAQKKVDTKSAFYVLTFIFGAISGILLVISFMIGGDAGFWIRFPIMILAMVLGIIYLSIFGVPFSGVLSKEWKEEEIEKEILKLYKAKDFTLPDDEDLSEEDRLELKQLERLKRKWERGEDFV